MSPDLKALEGRYQILEQLGFGGSGAVYRAIDTRLARDVAIKVLTAQSEDASARFMREAQAVARLNHPNIIAIYDVDRAADQLFIVQELLQGDALDDLQKRGIEIPLPAALDLLLQLVSALDAAHARGIIHRDFKPANIIILADGTAKLLDFGVAKVTDKPSLTQVGFVGTPAYAAPEQLAGDNVDLRADMFSFGVVAYEVLTGKRLFDGTSLPNIVQQVLFSPIPRLRLSVPDAPDELDAVVAQCLERDAAARPQSMAAISALLRAARRQVAEIPPVESWLHPPAVPPTPAAPDPGGMDVGMGTVIGPVLAPAAPPATSVHDTVTVPRRPATRPLAPGALPDGARVGKFTVHELVAPGQTGHLYKAFDPVRSRLIGLKVIHDATGASVDRLLRASRIWLDLHHPNLQRILEVDPGDVSAAAYVATELIEGVDLHTLLARRQLDLAQQIDIALQLCDALDYLHDRGIVHREVTPRNIVVTESPLRVTLLDSGLARPSAIDGPNLTVTGVVIGDFQYMAPEQTAGRHDQRSDIYSVGVVLYEMVLGRRFRSEAGRGTAGTSDTLAGLREELSQSGVVPARLCTALVTALQPNPVQRYSSAREMADALRPLVPQKLPALELSAVVVTVHGIRTHARWQRAFSETASRNGLHCRLDRWNFGNFSLLQFLTPWSRQAKVGWFREVYHDEFHDLASAPLSSERPSVVAHSFGTYILGNALLRYPYLRFNKVLLCGSILPDNFPWDVLIDRGQVQAVRNEFGARDGWTRAAQWFVPGTGPSGQSGFRLQHERLEQERFDYSHSEYFEKGHMSDNWMPFLKRRLSHITPQERDVRTPVGTHPVGLYAVYALLFLALAATVGLAVALAAGGGVP